MSHRTIEISVPALARIEGEGALDLKIRDGQIEELRLRIFEPPRLFEKLLEGRHYTDVPDIVARICGICPVAYQMSAVHAFEGLFEHTPTAWTTAMRRVFYCGEWIESHALHIHLLAAPDYLGYPDAIAMARDHPREVKRGLRLQALGNDIIRTFGARSVHPVGARVGGFSRAPSVADISALRTRLEAAIPEARELVTWAWQLPIPSETQPVTQVALRDPREYPMNHGRIVSSLGHNVAPEHFTQHFHEHQVAHSTALHATLDGQPYLVGPLARINLNFDRLHSDVRAELAALDFCPPANNPFNSLVARAAEVYYAVLEAQRLLEGYTVPESSYQTVTPRAGVAFAATEAPRGILWHRYEVDDNGYVARATIVPPTSQNLAQIEHHLAQSLAQFGLDQPEQNIRLHAERLIRSYDPCISCATHFLDLRLLRL